MIHVQLSNEFEIIKRIYNSSLSTIVTTIITIIRVHGD